MQKHEKDRRADLCKPPPMCDTARSNTPSCPSPRCCRGFMQWTMTYWRALARLVLPRQRSPPWLLCKFYKALAE